MGMFTNKKKVISTVEKFSKILPDASFMKERTTEKIFNKIINKILERSNLGFRYATFEKDFWPEPFTEIFENKNYNVKIGEAYVYVYWF